MRRIPFIGVMITAVFSCAVTLGFPQQLSTTDIVGGRGGNEFSDFQPPAGARVAEVRIRSGDTIDAVQMAYVLANGRTVLGPMHGGSGGRFITVRLDSDEYLIAIMGRYGDTIDSMQITTNKRTTAQFGGNGGSQRYRIEVPAGSQAIGFTGRSGATLDAVGLVYTPLPRRRDYYPADQAMSGQLGQTQLAGGGGGRPFTDQNVPAGARITEVVVRSGDTIDAVQAIYVLPDGRSLQGEQHGNSGGNSHTFRLDRDEYIIGLAGRFGDTVDSMRIITNKRTSQVYGGRGGDRDFRIDVPPGSQAIGFIGRSGNTVDAIGLVYMRMGYRR
jgi:hypothetical protein